jgi:hypothetical protein
MSGQRTQEEARLRASGRRQQHTVTCAARRQVHSWSAVSHVVLSDSLAHERTRLMPRIQQGLLGHRAAQRRDPHVAYRRDPIGSRAPPVRTSSFVQRLGSRAARMPSEQAPSATQPYGRTLISTASGLRSPIVALRGPFTKSGGKARSRTAWLSSNPSRAAQLGGRGEQAEQRPDSAHERGDLRATCRAPVSLWRLPFG